MNTQKTKINLISIAIIVIVLLLLLNGYLLYDKFSTKAKLEETKKELNSTIELKAQIEAEYYSAMSELEELRGENTELNELIDESKGIIKEQKAKIDALIRKGASAEEAKRQLKIFKEQVNQQIEELSRLREENEQLRAFNSELEVEKDKLRENLNKERVEKDSLKAIGKVVIEEKQTLERENKKLSAKVDKAAAIEVDNIEVKSYMIKEDGRLKRKRNAEKVQLIEVCFETTANEIADAGTEEFLVRIINPTGETMAMEALGSGIFEDQENGTQIRYTQSTQMRYDNEPTAGCTQWRPNIPFSSGAYEIEIYNKGYLVGKSVLNLR